jgi:LmbE family N-acetylglucosaminyl deacetylase
MKKLSKTLLLGFALLSSALSGAAQEPKAFPLPDERYKVDILLVVAHPDDEGAATSYLARALDEHKRVAIVICTRGSSGANKAGAEQAAALGDIREIEARNALAMLGITNVWFLDGKDTASQNVLQSLANWGHGVALEQLVRLIRLTRPEVILTFLPGTFIGEDHGDHQACGVLSTEAFDLAGDPVAFPEQVAGPANRRELFLENLRPWQPKKIYYFPDADREDIFRGKGPSYSVKEISKATKEPYWRMSLDSFRAHQTQAKEFLDSVAQMDEAQIEKMAASDGWTDDMRFVLGKSLVGGSVTGNIFDGITPGSIPFVRPEVSPEPSRPELSVELGGPYSLLRGVSARSWAHESPASGAAGDRAARTHHDGDSSVGAEPDGEGAGNFADCLVACGMDASKRRGEIHCSGEASGRRAARSPVACRSRNGNEEA